MFNETTDRSRAAAFALACASATLIAMLAAALVTLDRLKYAAIDFVRAGQPISELPGMVFRTLTPLDYLLLSAAAAGIAVTVALEIRSRGLSIGLSRAPRPWFILLLLALLLWFSQAFLYPGKLLGGDTLFHIARIAFVGDRLNDGGALYWNNFWHVGVPVLQFTGPLLFWLGGALDALVRDPYLAAKAVLLVCQVGSGFAVYALLRRFGLVHLPAMIGAIGYAGAWTHLHTLLYKGTLPQAITFLLLPLGMIAVQSVGRSRHLATVGWAGLALVGAALMVNHPTNGLFAGIYIALFALLGLVFGEIPRHRLPALLLAGLAGGVASLFVVVPTYVESGYTTLVMGSQSLFFFVLPDLDYVARLLTWSNGNTGPGSNFDAYLGIGLVALSGLGAWHTLRGRTAGMSLAWARALLLLLALSLVLRGAHVRSNIFTLLFVSAMAGVGAQAALESAKRYTFFPALLLLLVFLDLGSSAIQPIARTDKSYFDAAARRLLEDPQPGRLLLASTYSGPLAVSLWANPFMEYPIAQTGLPYGYSTTRYHNYGAVALKSVEWDLKSQRRLAPDTVEQLALAHVTRISNDTGTGLGLPEGIEGTVSDPALGRILKLDASPVIVSERLVEMVPPSGLDVPVLWDESFEGEGTENARAAESFVARVLSAMDLSADLRYAGALAVRERPAGWSDRANPEPLRFSVDSYTVTSGAVSMTLSANGNGYARLSHGWYPTHRVAHNGVEIAPARSSLSMLVVPLQKGENRYEILPAYTGLRRAMDAISLAGLAVIVAMGFAGSVRRSRIG